MPVMFVAAMLLACIARVSDPWWTSPSAEGLASGLAAACPSGSPIGDCEQYLVRADFVCTAAGSGRTEPLNGGSFLTSRSRGTAYGPARVLEVPHLHCNRLVQTEFVGAFRYVFVYIERIGTAAGDTAVDTMTF